MKENNHLLVILQVYLEYFFLFWVLATDGYNCTRCLATDGYNCTRCLATDGYNCTRYLGYRRIQLYRVFF